MLVPDTYLAKQHFKLLQKDGSKLQTCGITLHVVYTQAGSEWKIPTLTPQELYRGSLRSEIEINDIACQSLFTNVAFPKCGEARMRSLGFMILLLRAGF